MARTSSLELRSTLSALRVLLMQAVLLFAAAGTVHYWEAWLYLAMYASSTALTNLVLLRKDRALLERRLAFEAKQEQRRVQRLFFRLMPLLGLILLVLAGLDQRWQWSQAPFALSLLGCGLFTLGTYVVFRVMRENSFASSLIEVSDNQTLVSSGLYRWVRHPMYSGFLLSIGAVPLILGSYVALLIVPPVLVLFVLRLLDEEQLLQRELSGYDQYLRSTPRRLIPGIW